MNRSDAVKSIAPAAHVYGATYNGTKLVGVNSLIKEFAIASGHPVAEWYTMDYAEITKWMEAWCECWVAGYYCHEKHEFCSTDADKAGEGLDYVVVEDMS